VHISVFSPELDIFPIFKMAAAATLDFYVMRIWPFRRVDSVVFVFYTKFGSISVIVTEINALILQTFIS